MERIPAATILAVLLLGPLGVAGGDTAVYNTDGLRNAIYAASPGDRIYMAGPGDGGQYNSRLYVDGVHGELGNMIEIVAWKTNDRPVFTSDTAACFTLNRCSYILVDGGDYTAWADHYGDQPVPAWADGGWSIGNFTDDDVVDGADYTVWADNYLPAAGKQAGTGAGAVPEPSSAALMALGLAALLRRRR